MTKAKHRRGEVASPEIVALADTVAGVLSIIFSVDKTALLERPRPSGKLRSVRDVLMGILHHRLGVSQQKIAAALERDRGVVSDAAHALDEAAEGDEGVRFALAAITEKISELMAMAETWNEALDQSNLDRAIKAAAFKRATEEEDDDELEHDITIEELAASPAAKPAATNATAKRRSASIASAATRPIATPGPQLKPKRQAATASTRSIAGSAKGSDIAPRPPHFPTRPYSPGRRGVRNVPLVSQPSTRMARIHSGAFPHGPRPCAAESRSRRLYRAQA